MLTWIYNCVRSIKNFQSYYSRPVHIVEVRSLPISLFNENFQGKAEFENLHKTSSLMKQYKGILMNKHTKKGNIHSGTHELYN
jgi:hypothetical protein